MIGDSQIDVEAGRNAGSRTARILTGDGATFNCDVVGASLLDTVEKILKWGQPPVADRSNNTVCQKMTA
jgi:phosphoglycolate phosphatase-like HAD superfamily hydrolase